MRPNSPTLLVLLALWCSPAMAATGGPDGWGYSWADSAEAGVSYNYEWAPDRFGIGDDESVTRQLGFSFLFYGETYSSVSVNSNGLLHFNGSAPPSTNWPLPYEDYALVAPLWDNLNPPQGGELWSGTIGDAPNRIFIVEWFEVPHYSDVGSVNLEVKLFEADGAIEFHYEDISFDHGQYDWGASATVGIQDGGMGVGLQVSYNQASLANEYAIRFEPCPDGDGDGFGSSDCGGPDCDDGDPQVHPNATENCHDGVDNDCDGYTDAEDGDCGGDDDDDVADDDDSDDDDNVDDDAADGDDGQRGGPYGLRCTAASPTVSTDSNGWLLTLALALAATWLLRRRR